MIDLKHLRENPEHYQIACNNKGFSVDIQAFLDLDTEYRAQKTTFEELRAKQNASNKELKKLKGEDKA